VVVVATADEPPLVRRQAAFVATTVAEFFRDAGRTVLLMMDSLTRLAMVQREIGLAVGEPPATRGYPPSVFGILPRLLERAGTTAHAGNITGIYTVLVEGDDLNDPIADATRAILDGHIVLSAERAARGQWPAIDPVRTLSRVMDELVDDEHRRAAARVREVLATYERQRDLVLLGAYRKGADKATDDALARLPAVEAFLRQKRDERFSFADSRRALIGLFT
jgi:flagellum-specific ATP synthase